uniref:Uncharacterized protein n=1 Tax=Romanomermis culicivorax TaxID=13658 RepID=A0A915IYX8_ROMCU
MSNGSVQSSCTESVQSKHSNASDLSTKVGGTTIKNDKNAIDDLQILKLMIYKTSFSSFDNPNLRPLVGLTRRALVPMLASPNRRSYWRFAPTTGKSYKYCDPATIRGFGSDSSSNRHSTAMQSISNKDKAMLDLTSRKEFIICYESRTVKESPVFIMTKKDQILITFFLQADVFKSSKAKMSV